MSTITRERFTNEEKHKAALNEVNWRRKVYERLVSTGGMTRENADRRIAIMAEIAEDYAERAKGERLL